MHFVRLLFSVILAVAPLAGQAAATALSPINLHHSSWIARDGAPPSIIAIAQTPDRWLWLASTTGLYRFDGVRFERFQPPGEAGLGHDIWGMRVLGNGALWVGYRNGGASVWHQGRLRSFGSADGFSVSSVLDFELDWRGRTWASTSQGFRVFDGVRWSAPDDRNTGATGQCFLLADPEQTLWARCEHGAFMLRQGEQVLRPLPQALGFGRLALAADGTAWAMGSRPGQHVALSGPGRGRSVPAWPATREVGSMMFERDGQHVWLARKDGVLRIGPGEGAALFGMANGLSGSIPNCMFQDAEGSVWIGTENGLDRFRPQALSGVALPVIQWDTIAIAAGDKGALWINGSEVSRPGRDTLAALPPENPASAASAIHRNGDEVWIGARDGLWRYRGGRRERVALPENVASTQFHTIVTDRAGGLWVALRNDGVLRLKDGVWQPGGGYHQLERRADSILPDRHGRIWFGYSDNKLRLLENGQVRTFGEEQGLRIGKLLQIAESPHGVWLAGLNGLYHFDGVRFTQIQGRGDDPLLGISGIIDHGDALWLNGSAGITVIGKQELARAVADAAHRVDFRRLDHKDGLRGAATNSFPVPSAVAGSDGKLWFVTTAGLFWLDPASVMKNSLAPPVIIKNANVDGVVLPLQRDVPARLPAHSGRVQVDFTALSLAMPERMQFQYQLDGVDRGWQQGGTVRSATYTDLAPGRYTFRVRATNNDGVWSEGDAAATFLIEPAFYQSAWFRVLCALLLALALWAAYRLRMAQVAAQVAGRFEARLQERERIARDLHDTLLQTVQALLLQMQAAWHKLPPGEPARGDIERSLDLAQAALEEGRDKVQGLRSPGQGELLPELCRALRAEHPSLDVGMHASGAVRILAPAVQEELHAIALEALRNAARHAQASCISVAVSYGREALLLAVSDNGCGLPCDVAQAGQAAGRWGLVGMRERAQRIGARLILSSKPGQGTVLTVEVPARQAYG